MPRDSDALKIRKWADSGDRIDPDDASLNPRLSRALGWPASFSEAEGNAPRREVFNQLFCELSAIAHELNTRGMLEYSALQPYTHPAVVIRAADGMIFLSKRSNGPGNNQAGPPATDATDPDENDNWKSIVAFVDIPTVPGAPSNASTTVRGLIELATQSEVNTGTDNVRAVVPSTLAARLAALRAAIEAWANGRFTTTGGTNVVNSSTIARGIIELATQAEVNTGTDNVRAVTPATLASRLGSYATQAWVQARGYITQAQGDARYTRAGEVLASAYTVPNSGTGSLNISAAITNFRWLEFMFGTDDRIDHTRRVPVSQITARRGTQASSSVFYGLFGNTSSANARFYSINPSTGAATRIGNQISSRDTGISFRDGSMT